MKIEYISHACLLIETADLKIVTDPWFGSAYCNQWHVFPKPVNLDRLSDVDAVLISHGHEDHLHEASLRQMSKTARVLYPYHFFGGAKEYIESMDFGSVSEAVTYKKYELSAQTAVTYVINSHDSLMVIESGGKVLVNANDALHSYPRKVIDFYIAQIRERWHKIDALFCGFGGASYFPNVMHLAGKDDRQTAIVREQLFADNFCRVVAGLKPAVAVPFAADFALLSDEQRWINDYRFPRRRIADYYAQHFGDSNTEIRDLYSGDTIELFGDGKVEVGEKSPYRAEMRDDGTLEHLIDEQYSAEIEQIKEKTFLPESEAENIVAEICANVAKRMTNYKFERLQNLKFAVELTDVAERNFYHVAFENKAPKVWRAAANEADSLLKMKMSSEILRASIGSEWGADAISIGYGAEIFVADNRLAEIELESVCMSLLACYPTPLGTLKTSPLRVLEFMLSNPTKYTRSLRTLRRLNANSENYDRRIWLLNSPAEIRKIYDLPELEAAFLPKITP